MAVSLEDFDQPRNNAFLTVELTGGNIAEVVADLGRFAAASQHIVGLTVNSNAGFDATAFTGGHAVAHREDYSTITLALNSNEGIRHATHLLISDERLAEIADTYVLPEHLKNPANHVDAFIGHIIKGLVGYQDDTSESFADQAQASADTIIAKSAHSLAHIEAYSLMGEVNLERANDNALYRGEQVETMEHVLRFLIARENAKPYSNGDLYAGLDYEWATGILAEALTIVNGVNGFNENADPETNDLLYRGTLQSKSSVAVKEGVVYYSGVHGPEPIWPAEVAEAYQAEQLAKAQARDAEIQEQRLRHEMEAMEREETHRKQLGTIVEAMEVMAAEGFEWAGIMQVIPHGPLNSAEKIKKFYSEKYGVPIEDVHTISDAAILAGKAPTLDPGSVTVYIRGQNNIA